MSNINNLIGIPFKNGGRSIEGCDCMGLAIITHREFGVEIPNVKADATNSELINSVYNTIKDESSWEKIDTPVVPCIVVMGFCPECRDMVTHVGTYIGNNKVIHVLENDTSTTFRLDHPFFKNKILGFYKYEENSSNGNP